MRGLSRRADGIGWSSPQRDVFESHFARSLTRADEFDETNIYAESRERNRVSYTANTEPGSSGSPCFTGGLDLVALHHWGAAPNRGVRMAGILDYLSAHKDELAAKGFAGLGG